MGAACSHSKHPSRGGLADPKALCVRCRLCQSEGQPPRLALVAFEKGGAAWYQVAATPLRVGAEFAEARLPLASLRRASFSSASETSQTSASLEKVWIGLVMDGPAEGVFDLSRATLTAEPFRPDPANPARRRRLRLGHGHGPRRPGEGRFRPRRPERQALPEGRNSRFPAAATCGSRPRHPWANSKSSAARPSASPTGRNCPRALPGCSSASTSVAAHRTSPTPPRPPATSGRPSPSPSPPSSSAPGPRTTTAASTSTRNRLRHHRRPRHGQRQLRRRHHLDDRHRIRAVIRSPPPSSRVWASSGKAAGRFGVRRLDAALAAKRPSSLPSSPSAVRRTWGCRVLDAPASPRPLAPARGRFVLDAPASLFSSLPGECREWAR